MHYQLYQRQHPRSTNPAAKPYRFLKLPIALDTIPLEDELANIDLPWLLEFRLTSRFTKLNGLV